MQPYLFEPEFPLLAEELSKPVLKIFAACENEAACEQVMGVQSQLSLLCGNEVKILGLFRKFCLFHDEGSRKTALSQTMEADMIVVSLSGCGPLAQPVKHWVKEVSAHRRGQTALVILFDPTRRTWDQQEQIAWFREIASDNAWDFFCNVEELPGIHRVGPQLELLEDCRPGAIEIPIHFPPAWENWGIND